ncbi:M16 family metallopeptidase [Qipengyuania nanhaisediminis]|uniref:M16 family metallopeptidase n=1 Tax=Qipengyuania nanhaisediminis TaxID=604088 RepID=UPI0038B32638
MKSRTARCAALLLLSASIIAPASLVAEQPVATTGEQTVWPFETSDVPVDPGFVFGHLPNGMRYILRENATPDGTAVVRMRIDSGSLDETDAERGLSHFLEHMAFNGSANIPEGEMVKLLEREGLAFGADTNASTGYEAITYMLNLPRNDADLLDTALMLMRETASELTIAPDAVERERGVVLAERRDRRNYAAKAREDASDFLAPGARFTERRPIGTLETLENATADQLRALYERTYTPANTTLVIIGDFPAALVEERLRHWFASWDGGAAPVDPETGPVDITRRGETHVYLDPALSESVTITALGPWRDRPDTIANRRAGALRMVGYAIVNRRLARLAREADAPFRSARLASRDIFEDARSTTIVVSSEDGQWERGVSAAVHTVNRALIHGFTEAEIAEQLANIRTALENRVEAASTRSNRALAGSALALVSREAIPTEPRFQLGLFEEMARDFTPGSVLAALRADAAPLTAPLIRFQGRTAPEGGRQALRAAFDEAMARPVAAPETQAPANFAYDDFGEPGRVVTDTRDERLGFRYLTFENGARLTLKATDIREDQVRFRVSVDGGRLMNTREDPLATYLIGSLPAGGLGAHSQDELLSVLAGRSVGLRVSNTSDAFAFSGATTRRDLALQMQLIAAGLTDPGYRPEAIERFRRGIDNYFRSILATPAGAYGAKQGAILSDGDPRFTLQSRDDYFALDFARLEAVIADRLENGAIEAALVGDFDEDAAIAAFAATLGALPEREPAFHERGEARERRFTETRGVHVIRHEGEADQALVRLVWPTRDDSDLAETLRLSLTARVLRLALTERLREELGQAYSVQAVSAPSQIYPGYGTFTVSGPVEASEVETVRAAIREVIGDIREGGVDDDLVERARQPLIEAYDNALKSLGGWMGLAARAQSRSDRLDRWFAGPATLSAITPDEIVRTARTWLEPGEAVEFLVLPAEPEDQVTRPPASDLPQHAPARLVESGD